MKTMYKITPEVYINIPGLSIIFIIYLIALPIGLFFAQMITGSIFQYGFIWGSFSIGVIIILILYSSTRLTYFIIVFQKDTIILYSFIGKKILSQDNVMKVILDRFYTDDDKYKDIIGGFEPAGRFDLIVKKGFFDYLFPDGISREHKIKPEKGEYRFLLSMIISPSLRWRIIQTLGVPIEYEYGTNDH